MYIERQAFDKIPPNAIVLSEKEVVDKLQDIIFNWPSNKELWAFKFGPLILSIYNLATTTNIAAYYRMRVKLPNSGHIPFYFLTAGVCGIFTLFSHHMIVQNDIILQKECTECTYARAAAFTTAMFGVYGLFSSCFATAISANVLRTYPLEGFESWAQVKGTVKQYLHLSKRISYRLVGFPVFGAILTCAIIHKQYQQFEFLNQQLFERDRKLRQYAAVVQATKAKAK